MKQFFKIFIPILLALAIVLCLGWYFLTYDRDFTRDMLLYGARRSDAQGKSTMSAWFYDRAYDLAKDNDQVAIELANQHKADGNYTQAEKTLTKAIEDGGGTDLYIALCKTYVEQDKLLDAVKLLNGITNQQTKAQLDAIRPAAPVASPAPGFYNQYISVTVTGDDGTLLVNPIPEYPSVYDQPFSTPIPLHDGENTIYAVVVGDNGLVSPLSIFGYTVGGVVEEVVFADAAIEIAVREMLSIPTGTPVMSNQLWEITSFTLPEGVQSLTDLKYMIFLEDLVLPSAPAGQLAVLAGLTHLTSLEIYDTSVSTEEMEYIGSLTALERLVLNSCNVVTVSPLAKLTKLTYLDLSNNTIRNIQPLSEMKNLQELYMEQNALTDLTQLASLSNLKILDVSNNSLPTLAPIFGLPSLTWLDAGTNLLTDLSNVEYLSNLSYLCVAFNTISDAQPLGNCASLKELDISNNQFTDLSPVAKLTGLEIFNFSYNQVKAIPSFPVDCALITIDGSYNLIESMKPLQGLRALNNIYMDYNTEVSTLKWLAENPTLVLVNVYGTKINDMEHVAELTEHSIIVNFTPLQDN